jgi:HEAT repeat protein
MRHREVMITDRESIKILKEKISNGEPGEVMLAMHLVKSQPEAIQEEMLLAALHNSSPIVQCEAISLVRGRKMVNLLHEVKEISLQSKNQDVLVMALSVLAATDPAFDYDGFLSNANPDIARAAIVYSLKKKNSSSMEARQLLISWVHSPDDSLRLQAAKTMAELTGDDVHSLIMELLHDSNLRVQEAAILAAGKQHNELLNQELMGMLYEQNNHSAIIEALRMQGGLVIDLVQDFILSSPDEVLRGKMIIALGKINDPRAPLVLDQLTDEIPAMRETIFKAMNHAGFKAGHQLKAKYQKFVRDNLNSSAYLVYLMRYLQSERADATLINALQLELISVRDDLLQLFSFLYDAGSIKKATAGLKINSNESVATSLEILSESVTHEFSKIFITLFENTSLDHKCNELKAHYPEPHLTKAIACDNILRDRHHHFNAWSKSCVMYFMRNEMRRSGKASIEQLMHSPDPLLKETSHWVLNFMAGLSTDSSRLVT